MMKVDNTNWMQLEIPARADNVGTARVAVAAFAAEAGFTLTQVDEIKIIVSEAVSNVVLHAYPGERAGTVSISARIDGELLTIQVRDEGVGIEDVCRARCTNFSTLQGRVGMGFTFMDSFSDELCVCSGSGEGTRVTARITRKSSSGCGETKHEP